MGRDYPDWSNPVIPGTFTLGGNGAKLVALAGTAVPIHAALVVKMVMVEALAANVGTVYLGTSTVTADTSATGGLQLQPGALVAFPCNDLSQVYVNGAAADGVSFMYWT